ncbi:MAG: hypothetical protein R2940_01665 [Syntrophotaleaceae bacterium]
MAEKLFAIEKGSKQVKRILEKTIESEVRTGKRANQEASALAQLASFGFSMQKPACRNGFRLTVFCHLGVKGVVGKHLSNFQQQ